MNFYKKILHIILVGLVPTILFSASVDEYVDKAKCDQIIDKQLYQICYSYKYKGALSGWVKLDGNLVGKSDIKKRPKFYNEKTIPMKYRTKNKDYTGYGKDWNRGHFIVADADFDYDKKVLNKAYTMANIIPQAFYQKTWLKAERYERYVASKLGSVTVINGVNYSDFPKRIGNNKIAVPDSFWKMIYNDKLNFKKCFLYQNTNDFNVIADTLREHEIDCSLLEKKEK